MEWRAVFAVVVGALWAVPAAAQTTPATFQTLRDDRRIELGDSFIVTQRDGTRVTGQLQALSPGTLRLRTNGKVLELAEGEVARIQRRDRADDGAVYGAIAGAGAAAAYTAMACDNDSECTANVAVGLGGPMLLGGGIVGYLIDRAMTRVVFDAPAADAARITIVPVVSRHRRGVSLSIGW